MVITRRNFIRNAFVISVAGSCKYSLLNQASGAENTSTGSPPIYYDSDGLIVHKGLDGGDTSQREGWYWFGTWLREAKLHNPWPIPRKLQFQEVIRLLEPRANGVFYRHPKLQPWNNPYDKEFGFSRDQMIPLVAAMGVLNSTEPLHRLWNALPQDTVGGTKHTFNGQWTPSDAVRLFYTGDVIGPAMINLYRRALNQNPVDGSDQNGPGGEQELAANVGLRLSASLNDRDNTGDDLNLIVMLLMSILFFPSSTSSQAATAYAKNRPVSYGSFLGAYRDKYGVDLNASAAEVKRRMDEGIASGWKTDASRVYGAVRWYHRVEAGANPQLAELYEPIIRGYLE